MRSSAKSRDLGIGSRFSLFYHSITEITEWHGEKLSALHSVLRVLCGKFFPALPHHPHFLTQLNPLNPKHSTLNHPSPTSPPHSLPPLTPPYIKGASRFKLPMSTSSAADLGKEDLKYVYFPCSMELQWNSSEGFVCNKYENRVFSPTSCTHWGRSPL